MKPIEERGWLILAQNNGTHDYVMCARALARSLRATRTKYKICLLTDVEPEDSSDFDFVKIFPFGDRATDIGWKLANDWQVFYSSPFRQTIKIEADVFVPRNIDHWFDCCQQRDLVTMVGTRDYHGHSSASRFYRKVFDDNHLPDVYNAIVYWRLSATAQQFFNCVREIFENWSHCMSALKFAMDQPLNTDLAYALALRLLGGDQYILPDCVLSMVHLKSRINQFAHDDWRREIIWEKSPGSFRINTVEQKWPVHYHIKEFARELL